MQSTRIIIAAALVWVAAPRMHAQVVTGQLEGWVVTEDGSPLVSAEVAVSGPGFRARSLVTDGRGYFAFLALPPGTYELSTSFLGRSPVQVPAVVHIGRTTSVGKLASPVRPIAMDALTADARRPLLDPSSAKLGTFLTRSSVEWLPTERGYTQVAAILPHVANSTFGDGLNFAGATGLENHFYVDGANTTHPVDGADGLRLPYNFVKEVEVRTGGYEAEYRGSMGGVVNVVTQSGTNEHRRELFAFYAGARLGPMPTLDMRRVNPMDYATYDLGASVAGPLRRDRMWYFLAWNPEFNQQEVQLPGWGVETDRRVEHRFAGKVHWQPTARTRIELNALGTPSTGKRVGPEYVYEPPTKLLSPDAYLSEGRSGATSYSARATHFLTPGLLLEASADRSTWSSINHGREGSSDALTFIDEFSEPGEVIWSGGYPDDSERNVRRVAGGVRLTAARGAHQWKAGIDVERTSAGGRENHERLRHGEDGNWELYYSGYDGDGEVANRGLGAFVQDSWLLGERLRLNYGVRWGRERVYGSDGSLAVKFKDQWGPRVGAIFVPDRPGRHKISTSFGRFYQQLPLNGPVMEFTAGSRTEWINYDHDPRLDASGGTSEASIDLPDWAIGLELESVYYDEWTLGYERTFNPETKASVRVIRRDLGQAIEDGALDWEWSWGNPGSGELAHLPRATRHYTGLDISLEHALSNRAFVIGSYVLSRTHGNYPGYFASDFGYPGPNWNSGFDMPDMQSTGLLPNDRPHVFKLAGWYRFGRAPLTLGGSFLWQSGTPRSQFGGTQAGPPWFGFVTPRGSEGRTPVVRDLNLRAALRLPRMMRDATLLLDVFHVLSGRTPLQYDQQRYRELDAEGRQTSPNPDYGRVLTHQAPTSMRLGVQLGF